MQTTIGKPNNHLLSLLLEFFESVANKPTARNQHSNNTSTAKQTQTTPVLNHQFYRGRCNPLENSHLLEPNPAQTLVSKPDFYYRGGYVNAYTDKTNSKSESEPSPDFGVNNRYYRGNVTRK